jgi:hypothetical protein
MYNLSAAEGYAAAVIIEGKDHKLDYLEWDWTR